MIEIKPLGPADAHLLNNVAGDVFDDPIVDAAVREFLGDPRHRLVVALDRDLIVGFVSAVIYLHPDKAAPELWINEFGVASTHQRQGIGRALLQGMLDIARQSGCTEARVLTERDNLPAMAMYTSSGGIESSPDPVMFTFKL
jgi:aminoglycoside 6'-N-acetyltransferase I